MSELKLIDFEKIKSETEELRQAWNSREKFGYLIIEDFFHKDVAENLYAGFPNLSSFGETSRTYLNGKGKYQKTKFEDLPDYGQVFSELNSEVFLAQLEQITGIQNLLPDHDLFGGGLHQSVAGAYLNVHIDFNIHQETKHYRRMNILVYMNKNWQKDYNGYLELWDMEKKSMLEYIEPSFNRCVIFETNEKSYHGHPKPIATPPNVSRNSIAAYYYTAEYPVEHAESHSTVYVNTEGTKGWLKSVKGGAKAILERIIGRK